jgi:uncharacterized protein YuzE
MPRAGRVQSACKYNEWTREYFAGPQVFGNGGPAGCGFALNQVGALRAIIGAEDLRRGSPGKTAMKTIYDSEADALYVRFSDSAVVESEEVSNGVVLDFDADGRIVAIELLDATKHVAAGATFPSAAE